MKGLARIVEREASWVAAKNDFWLKSYLGLKQNFAIVFAKIYVLFDKRNNGHLEWKVGSIYYRGPSLC